MSDARRTFETHVLPHLDAAYNLARWLLRSDQAAQDAVQEASMRAFRYVDSLRVPTARAWLLGIVRNTCYSMLERQRQEPDLLEFDEEAFAAELGAHAAQSADPQAQWQQQRTRTQIDAAIRTLTPALREVIVLREFEELDYAQIAEILAVPIGTVMSRLSRARQRLRDALAQVRLGE